MPVPFGGHLTPMRRGVLVKERPIATRIHSLAPYQTVG